MAIEQGVVVRLGTDGSRTAWVKTERSSACESCASRESCNPGADGKAQEVEAINAADARVGDRIQVVIGTGAMLKATFLLYLFPIICMLAGGLLGDWLAPRMQLHTSALPVVLAMLFFGLALVVVRLSGRRMGRQEAYQPKIVRVLGRQPEGEAAGDGPPCVNRIQPIE